MPKRRTAAQRAASRKNLELARRKRIANKSKMNFTKRTALEATRPSKELGQIRDQAHKVEKRLRAMLRDKPMTKKQLAGKKASKSKALPMPPRPDW